MQLKEVRLYSKENLDSLEWSDSYDDTYLKNYFSPLILEGTKKYISNVDAECFIIKVGDKLAPCVLSNHLKDCYVASPYSHYITYAREELITIDNAIIEKVISSIISILGFSLKQSKFNQSVYVNNWLLSTNLYIDLDEDEILAINKKLKESYPNRTIIYRSLNDKTNNELIKNCSNIGMNKILSRQVYITDPNDSVYKKRKDFVKDKNFLNRTKLKIQEETFSTENLENIRKMYNQLYLDKYFYLNPQFTMEFFENSNKHSLFEFKYLSDYNKPKAALGYFVRNGVMTAPIFGFDTQAAPREGLYRLISALLMKDSEEKNIILNQSSGASHFKSQRGALPYLEYNYYDNRHCSAKQRYSWKILSFFLNSFGGYMLKKFKL